MKVLSIAYYTVLRNFRDRKTFINRLLLPIVLILILGNALGGFYTTKNISKTNTGYLNMDKGEMSKSFDDFLQNKEIKDLLEIKKISSMDEGKKLIDNNKISSLIVIEGNYSDTIKNGGKGKIEVYGREYSDFRLSIVQNVVESYINGANTTQAMMRISSINPQYQVTENILETPVSASGKRPRAIDYYIVTMLAMTVMYNVYQGNSAIGELYYSRLGKRMKSTPVNPVESLMGIVIGTLVTVLLQSLILIGFTKYVYKANWGNSMGMVLFITMSLAVLAITLGGMVSVITGDENRTSAILGVLVPIFTFISGGYSQIITDNPLISKIMYLSPNYLAHNALFNTIYGGSISMNIQYLSTYGCIAAMWILTAVMLIITAYVGRRKLSDSIF